MKKHLPLALIRLINKRIEKRLRGRVERLEAINLKLQKCNTLLRRKLYQSQYYVSHRGKKLKSIRNYQVAVNKLMKLRDDIKRKSLFYRLYPNPERVPGDKKVIFRLTPNDARVLYGILKSGTLHQYKMSNVPKGHQRVFLPYDAKQRLKTILKHRLVRLNKESLYLNGYWAFK